MAISKGYSHYNSYNLPLETNEKKKPNFRDERDLMVI